MIALAIFAALQVADVTLTTLILRRGSRELNPAMRWLMRKLARIQKERCKLLCEGVALHGTDLGLSEGVTTEVVAPKED